MDASTFRVPPRVAALAQRQQLGALVAAHKGDHPLVECLTGLVIAAILFGAAAGVGWLGQFFLVKPLAILVILLAIGGLAATGYAFFRLFRAYVVVYHYQHGLVWTRNRRTDAAQFSWIDEMYVTRKDAKATAAGLVTFDGRTLDVTGADKADYTAFVDRHRGGADRPPPPGPAGPPRGQPRPARRRHQRPRDRRHRRPRRRRPHRRDRRPAGQGRPAGRRRRPSSAS